MTIHYVILVFFILLGSMDVSASCASVTPTVRGKFKIVSITKAEMKCEKNGSLRYPGCVIKVSGFSLPPIKAPIEYSVYANKEICSEEVGGTFEMEIESECCDNLIDISCEDANSYFYQKPRSDSAYSCGTTEGMYIAACSSTEPDKPKKIGLFDSFGGGTKDKGPRKFGCGFQKR